jgi:threonine dehydratase
VTAIADSDVADAARALDGVAVRTPLVWIEPLGAWLKLESRQPMGAFKIRGAYNAIRKLSPETRGRGVITFSSGNHGQAVAFAAQRFGVRAVVVMPETAPSVKVDGVKRWGGEVVMAGRTSEDRRIAALEIAERERLAVIPPFDHPDIIAGQATVGVEIAADLPDVATVVVPVGGGGLISGVVRGLAASGSRARVVGVEPAGAPKLTRSLAAGRPVTLDRTASVADGLITLTVGALPFAVLQADAARLAGVVTVQDDSIREAMHFLHRDCGLTVEPSGAATTAALRSGALDPFRIAPLVLVVSGGNVDPALLEEAPHS